MWRKGSIGAPCGCPVTFSLLLKGQLCLWEGLTGSKTNGNLELEDASIFFYLVEKKKSSRAGHSYHDKAPTGGGNIRSRHSGHNARGEWGEDRK